MTHRFASFLPRRLGNQPLRPWRMLVFLVLSAVIIGSLWPKPVEPAPITFGGVELRQVNVMIHLSGTPGVPWSTGFSLREALFEEFSKYGPERLTYAELHLERGEMLNQTRSSCDVTMKMNGTFVLSCLQNDQLDCNQGEGEFTRINDVLVPIQEFVRCLRLSRPVAFLELG